MKTSKKMKTTKANLFLVGCSVALLMAYGCSKENVLNPAGNCFGGNWAEQYSNELQAWSNAAQAYSENPTAGNCSDYKKAAKSYLDALESVYKCVPTTNRAEIKQAIDEAKADVDKEGCD